MSAVWMFTAYTSSKLKGNRTILLNRTALKLHDKKWDWHINVAIHLTHHLLNRVSLVSMHYVELCNFAKMHDLHLCKCEIPADITPTAPVAARHRCMSSKNWILPLAKTGILIFFLKQKATKEAWIIKLQRRTWNN